MTTRMVAAASSRSPQAACATSDPIVLETTVDLDGPVREVARSVSFLRECGSFATPVRWRCRAASETDLVALRHLWPPQQLEGGRPDELAIWRERFRYGLCYFRRGPGFLLVKDARDPAGTVRFTLDEPDLIAAFLTCLAPTPAESLSGPRQRAARDLVNERLLLEFDGLLVTLPTRVDRWPIPFTAV